MFFPDGGLDGIAARQSVIEPRHRTVAEGRTFLDAADALGPGRPAHLAKRQERRQECYAGQAQQGEPSPFRKIEKQAGQDQRRGQCRDDHRPQQRRPDVFEQACRPGAVDGEVEVDGFGFGHGR